MAAIPADSYKFAINGCYTSRFCNHSQVIFFALIELIRNFATTQISETCKAMKEQHDFLTFHSYFKILSMTKKTISAFSIFLVFVAIFGATVSLANKYLRSHNMDSSLTLCVLGLILFAVYYYAWRWVCRKIDNI